MALTVGTLVAFLTLNDQQYRQRLAEGQRAAQQTGSAVSGAFKSISVGISVASVATTGLLTKLLSVGKGYNTLEQTSRASLAAIMKGTEAANAQMDKLFAFTQTSPLPKQVFIEAQQTLIGYGVQAEKVIGILEGVNNATVALAGDGETVMRITGAIAEIQSMGKITGDTIQSLASVGINAAEIMAAQFGITGAEMKQQITDGTVGASEAIDALVAALQDTYGGASEGVKNQWVGAADRIKAAWRDTGAALMTPLIDPKGGGLAVRWGNDFADILRAVQGQAKGVVQILMGEFGPALDGVSQKLKTVRDWVRDLDTQALSGLIQKLRDSAPVIAGIGAGLAAMAGGSLPIIGGLVSGINPLVAALVALGLATPQVRTALGDVFNALTPLGPPIQALIDACIQLVQTAAEMAGSVLSGLVPALTTLMAALCGD